MLRKEASNWWYVKSGELEGWAPGTYLSVDIYAKIINLTQPTIFESYIVCFQKKKPEVIAPKPSKAAIQNAVTKSTNTVQPEPHIDSRVIQVSTIVKHRIVQNVQNKLFITFVLQLLDDRVTKRRRKETLLSRVGVICSNKSEQELICRNKIPK